MPEQLVFTQFLNRHLAAPVDALLRAVHVTPVYADAPISNAVAMELLVTLVLLAFFVAIRLTLSVEKPNAFQQIAEMTNSFVSGQGESIVGHGYEKFVSFLSVIFLFILVANLMGLVPTLESPTANPTVPLGLAIVTFFYYHYHGIRSNGPGYIKQFLGPVWWLYPLMFIIEVVSHLARVLSLTVRLYANMFAGDLVTLAFFSLVPIGIPLVFMSLHLMVAGIQAYVFMLLATIYLSLAVSHEH